MVNNSITIEELKNKATLIFRSYPVNKAILFGSYEKNRAGNDSDIDLYIDSNGKLKGLDFIGLLEELVNALGKDIDLFDKSHIEPESSILKEIETEGVVLYEK